MFELNKVARVEIAKFVHEEEHAFRIRNQRNRRLGRWLAAELGLSEEAPDYADTIVGIGVVNADDRRLVGEIEADLERRGSRIPEAVILAELARQARAPLSEDAPQAPASPAATSRMPAIAAAISASSPSVEWTT